MRRLLVVRSGVLLAAWFATGALSAGCSEAPPPAPQVAPSGAAQAGGADPAADRAADPGGVPARDDAAVPGFVVVLTPELDGAIVPREFMELQTGAARHARAGMPEFPADYYWTPSVGEVMAAQSRVRAAMFAAATGEVAGVFGDGPAPPRRAEAPAAIRDIVSEWESYRMQYLGLVLSGRQFIACNAFPKADAVGTAGERWKRYWVNAPGGGRWYWQIRYDVAADACLGFDVNPEH